MPVAAAAAVATCVAMFGVDYGYPNYNYYIGISDGTQAGTELIYKAAGDAYYFTNVGKSVVFSGYSEKAGREIWVTDGTAKGTKLLKDIYVGASFSSNPGRAMTGYEFAKAGKNVVFSAEDYKYGREMWTTDGTPEGTKLLKDARWGESDGVGGSSDFLVSNGTRAFYNVSDSVSGYSIWSTEGQKKNTILTNQDASADDGYANDVGFIGGDILYADGTELWTSSADGKRSNLIKNFPGYYIRGLGHYSSKGYSLFSAYDSKNGTELWITDGKNKGTKLLKNIMLYDSSSYPEDFFDAGEFVLFTAISDGRGRELWVSRGTASSTRLLKEFVPGATDTEFGSFAKLGKNVVFAARVIEKGYYYYRLFITDGTPSGTKQLSKTAQPYGQMVSLGKTVVYQDSSSYSPELWSTSAKYGDQKRVSSFYKKGSYFDIEYIRPVNVYKKNVKASPCPE